MKSGKYAHTAFALLISIILVVITTIAIRYIHSYEQINIKNHVITRLDSITRLINLWSNNFRSGVSLLAEEPKLISLVDDYLSGRKSEQETREVLDQWLRAIYLGRGYEGHSIITPELTIILASSPAYIGKQVTSETSKKTILTAFTQGNSIGHISESVYPVRNIDGSDHNTIFQLGCARILKQNKPIAVLCLRQNPYHNFFAMLETGFSGETGEAYAINAEGNIISPTRFNNAEKTLTFNKKLQARAPVRSYGRQHDNQQNAKRQLTTAVALAMEKGSSGYVDNYADYRGISVVGAVKWIPELDMGIVIEQDVSEVYGPYHFSRKAIIFLTLIAILLINLLSIALFFNRKNLALREERMRAFLNNFPGIVHMRDLNGRFLILNKMVDKLIDTPVQKIIGTTGESLPFPKNYINKMWEDHEAVIKTGNVIISTEKTTSIFKMDYEWIKIIRFPVFDADQINIIAVGTIIQDMSEQMQNAQELLKIRLNLERIVEERTRQLESARIEAEQAAQTKANFMANMSHELRTPMNAIIGLSHLATLVSDDPKLHSYLQRIHQSSTHLLSIINDILDFSKIEADKMTLDYSEFSLEDLIDKVVGLVSNKAIEKNLELLVHVDQNVPLFIKGDNLRIGQILINFCSNAIKFTNHGFIKINLKKTFEDENQLKLTFDVEDTGIGISDQGIAELFKPFHQLDTSLTRQFEGTGLGLAISKNLIEKMGGEVSVSSKPGSGSIFSMEIPFKKSASNNISFYYESKNTGIHNRSALIISNNSFVEDNLRYMLDIFLIKASRIDVTGNPLCFLNYLDPFDFIFINEDEQIDTHTDQIRNFERFNQIKKPIFILLKNSHKNNELFETESLFDFILTKPILPSNLLDALTGMIEKPSPKKNTFDLASFRCLNSIKILLVDDNEINQDVVKELLGLLDIKIDLCNNGSDALKHLQQESVDLVLMDVQMPGMDGYETTRRIRQDLQLKTLPIIAMTANALDGDREKCLQVGMDDYLSKPIIPQLLFETLLKWSHVSATENPVADNGLLNYDSYEIALPELKRLSEISDLDIPSALFRLLNNESFYCKLLEKFTLSRSDIAEEITEAVQKNDFEEASRLAHSFKSLAGTIGSIKLQELALELEIGLNQSDFNENLLNELVRELQSLITKIQSSLFNP